MQVLQSLKVDVTAIDDIASAGAVRALAASLVAGIVFWIAAAAIFVF